MQVRSSGYRRAAGSRSPSRHSTSRAEETQHRWPSFLPDGRHFLYLARGRAASREWVFVGSLDGSEVQQLVSVDSPAVYAPPGYLLYVREGTLMAQPFDAEKRRLTGDASPVAEQIAPVGAAGRPRLFRLLQPGARLPNGRQPGTGPARLVRPHGSQARDAGRDRGLLEPRALSRRQACRRRPARPEDLTRDIWLFELERGTASRLTFDPADDFNPAFSPDGTRILFTSTRKGPRDIYWKASTGVGEDEPVLESENAKSVDDWSPDGRLVVYDTGGRRRGRGGERPLGGAARRRPQADSVPGAAVHRHPGPGLARRPLHRLQLRRVGHSGGLRHGLPEAHREVEGLDRRRGGAPVAARRARAVLLGGRPPKLMAVDVRAVARRSRPASPEPCSNRTSTPARPSGTVTSRARTASGS